MNANNLNFVRKLLVQLPKTEEFELVCEEVIDALEMYTEYVARGEDPSQVLPLVKKHIELCGCCREEHDALLRMVRDNNFI
jgi:hypothetical protein